MSERFIKFIPSEEAFWLMQHKPNSFRLLTHIANTARRINGHPDGLTIGQCHLQHWTFYGLTEREYRTAKQILEKRKHIIIIQTNRTRQKSTTGSTTNSTLVQLCSLTIWDINSEETDDRIDVRATTDRRPTDDKQERRRKNKNEKEEQNIAQPAARPRQKIQDSLFFDFETWTFSGTTEKDFHDWKILFPHITLETEMLRASSWLKSNPTKAGKKNWRRFLTGWFTRANENLERKKAYSSMNSSVDRRTKLQDGSPIPPPNKVF